MPPKAQTTRTARELAAAKARAATLQEQVHAMASMNLARVAAQLRPKLARMVLDGTATQLLELEHELDVYGQELGVMNEVVAELKDEREAREVLERRVAELETVNAALRQEVSEARLGGNGGIAASGARVACGQGVETPCDLSQIGRTAAETEGGNVSHERRLRSIVLSNAQCTDNEITPRYAGLAKARRRRGKRAA